MIVEGTFHLTTDGNHPHGSFVGQYCQGQAQEITVVVIQALAIVSGAPRRSALESAKKFDHPCPHVVSSKRVPIVPQLVILEVIRSRWINPQVRAAIAAVCKLNIIIPSGQNGKCCPLLP